VHERRHRQRLAIGAAALITTVATIATLTGLTSAAAQQVADAVRTFTTCPGDHWVAAWTAAPQSSSLGRPDDTPAGAVDGPARTFRDQTVRIGVTPHTSGSAIRVHLSNRYGLVPVTVTSATIGEQDGDAALASGTVRPLTFGGAPGFSIPSGGEVVSDPLVADVTPFAPLAVSAHVAGPAAPDFHQWAQTTNYATAPASGDHAADISGAAFTQSFSSSYLVSGVDVMTSSAVGVVVALGDSITDGIGSTPSKDHRWPDALARRFVESSTPLTIVNAGIGGNRVAKSTSGIGQAASSRVSRDALDQPGVTDVVVFEGINDITTSNGGSEVASRVIDGYRAIIEKAHSKGVRVTGATITPAGLTGSRESARREINTWIRTSGGFDRVLDFDSVVRDPKQPSRVRPTYDARMAHLTDAGYQELANSIDPSLFRGTGCRA